MRLWTRVMEAGSSGGRDPSSSLTSLARDSSSNFPRSTSPSSSPSSSVSAPVSASPVSAMDIPNRADVSSSEFNPSVRTSVKVTAKYSHVRTHTHTHREGPNTVPLDNQSTQKGYHRIPAPRNRGNRSESRGHFHAHIRKGGDDAHTRVHAHAHAHTCTHTRTHANKHTHAHHTNTYMHAYTHTHTYTQQTHTFILRVLGTLTCPTNRLWPRTITHDATSVLSVIQGQPQKRYS